MMTTLDALDLRAIICSLSIFFTLSSCDFLDPTEVSNPRTTPEELADAPEPTAALLPGLRAQYARAFNAVVVATSVGSDDYSSHRTGLGGNEIDSPRRVEPNNALISSSLELGIYWNLQELRALSDFVLDEISPTDETATSEQLSEAYYYRGMAYLMLGENFVGAPVEADGAAIAAAQLLQNAVSDFTEAESRDPNGVFSMRAKAALARTHRALGNAAEAGQFAQAALDAAGNDFVFEQEYDNTSPDASLDNLAHAFLVSRSLKEMQPLPRLDFLDPKYSGEDSPIASEKAEEMYLILAETAMANGDYTSGRNHMVNAANLALTRATDSIDDDDQRLNDDLTIRPRNAEIQIRSDVNSPYRPGLVLTRPGAIDTPTISSTSITEDSLMAVPIANELQLRRLLFTLRQEIMLMEGRRLHDLGIRYPMMLREIDSNPNIKDGDFGTEVSVPDYIPDGNEMDLYTPVDLYDGDGNLIVNQVTILHDMNLVIARDRGLVLTNPLLP